MMWLDKFGDTDPIVFYVFCGVSAILVVIGFIVCFLPCCLPNVLAISPGGTIDFYIVIGGRLLAFTVLAKGVGVAWASVEALNAICQLYPAALLIGLTMFMGGLLVKASAIYSFKWFKKYTAISDEWKANLAMWGLLIAIAIAAVVWCVLFTPVLHEVTLEKYTCYSSEGDFEWKVGTAAWHGLLLLLAVIMMPLACKQSRKAPSRRQGTALFCAVINTVLSVVAGICFYFLYNGSGTMMYAVIGGLTLWMVLFADLSLLIATVLMAKKRKREVKYEYEDERYDVIKEDAVSGEDIEIHEMTSERDHGISNKNYDTLEEEKPETFNY